MLKGKQRAYLRGIANTLNPTIIIGKEGITEALLKETDAALECHEIIKIKIPFKVQKYDIIRVKVS